MIEREPITSLPSFLSEDLRDSWFALDAKCKFQMVSFLGKAEEFMPLRPFVGADLESAISTCQSTISKFLGGLTYFGGKLSPYRETWNRMSDFSSSQLKKDKEREKICIAFQEQACNQVEELLRKSKVVLPVNAWEYVSESIVWASMADKEEFKINIPGILWGLNDCGFFGFEFTRESGRERAKLYFLYKSSNKAQKFALEMPLPKEETGFADFSKSSFLALYINQR